VSDPAAASPAGTVAGTVVGTVALLFPGQGAQTVGMGRAAYDRSAAARAVFARADRALGLPLSRLCFEGPEDDLRQTRHQQPAILACSLALLAARQEQAGPFAATVATGHSLGLYSALVAAGSLTLEEALRLVARRGELMQRAADRVPGGMAAVLGADDATVEAVCAEASRDGGEGMDVVVAANYNAPEQVVISGARAPLERAMVLLRERGARKVVPLAVAGAFHSPLMRPAAEELRPALDAAPIADPAYPVIANSAPALLRTAEAIRAELAMQVLAPVRWTAAVRAIAAAPDAPEAFVDCGPGATLAALLKRIAPGATVVKLDEPVAVSYEP